MYAIPSLCLSVDAGVRAVAQQEKLFVTLILQMIFSEAITLYGLIIAIVMSGISIDSTVCFSS